MLEDKQKLEAKRFALVGRDPMVIIEKTVNKILKYAEKSKEKPLSEEEIQFATKLSYSLMNHEHAGVIDQDSIKELLRKQEEPFYDFLQRLPSFSPRGELQDDELIRENIKSRKTLERKADKDTKDTRLKQIQRSDKRIKSIREEEVEIDSKVPIIPSDPKDPEEPEAKDPEEPEAKDPEEPEAPKKKGPEYY